MKKVMMAIVAVICAVSVQGAAVIWGNEGLPITNLDGTTMTASQVATVKLVVELLNTSNSDVVIGTATGINTMEAGSLNGATSNYTFNTDATTGDLLKVYMTATFGSDDYYREITNSAWLISAINNGGTDTFLWSGEGLADTGWQLIPEPTAMALLAFGAAAVVLRRRFRK